MFVRVRDAAGYPREGALEDGSIDLGDRLVDPSSVEWLPPCTPSKVICLARNVAAHAAEHDSIVPSRPEYFLKPPSSIAAHGSTVRVPSAIDEVEYEAELAAVIARQASNVDREAAMSVVDGLTCMNDLSNRADQRSELNWVRGKAFDGAAPLGPGLVDPDAVPPDATIELRVNGEARQHGSRDEYAFDLETVIADLTRYVTLERGDVIALGTTAGVGPLADGDRVAIEIEGIGTLRHDVVYDG
ncbi:MAG: fumarylacetoacetate hydrolase family protein [Halobacteriota archaeon]